MNAKISSTTIKLNLSVDNEYVQRQITQYREEHANDLKDCIDGGETWEDGVGAFITLRAFEGSNEKAGTMSISTDIEWLDD